MLHTALKSSLMHTGHQKELHVKGGLGCAALAQLCWKKARIDTPRATAALEYSTSKFLHADYHISELSG